MQMIILKTPGDWSVQLSFCDFWFIGESSCSIEKNTVTPITTKHTKSAAKNDMKHAQWTITTNTKVHAISQQVDRQHLYEVLGALPSWLATYTFLIFYQERYWFFVWQTLSVLPLWLITSLFWVSVVGVLWVDLQYLLEDSQSTVH